MLTLHLQDRSSLVEVDERSTDCYETWLDKKGVDLMFLTDRERRRLEEEFGEKELEEDEMKELIEEVPMLTP